MFQQLLVCICIFLSSLTVHALANGSPLDGDPDIVRIRYGPTLVCTGVYIDPYTILTAAHCLLKPKPGPVMVHVAAIESKDDVELDVKVVGVVPNPDYKDQLWPSSDIGLIKTTENKKFEGAYTLAESVPIAGRAILIGTGRTQAYVDKFARTTGLNRYLRLGAVLSFVGHTQNAEHPTGEWVSIAHGDSGGTVLNAETGQIIAVNTTSTINQSSSLALPTYCSATSVATERNRSFILRHMGPNSQI